MPYLIRPYHPKDKDFLIDLMKLNVPRYFDESEIQEYIHYLENEIEEYFVIEEQGDIIGFGGINYFPQEGIARLAWDAVHPGYQAQGLGRQLVQHRITHIKKQAGIKKIIVRTSQLVYPFYKKMGFQLKKIQKDFWAEGYDLYQLELEV